MPPAPKSPEDDSEESSESRDSGSEIIEMKLNPLNPLLPPGFTKPNYFHGIPISSSILPMNYTTSPDIKSAPINESARIVKKAPNNKVEILCNEEEEEEEGSFGNNVLQNNTIMINREFELEFISNFIDFRYKKTIPDIFCGCWNKLTIVQRLRKIKDCPIGNESLTVKVQNLLKSNFEDKIEKLKGTSFVDIYMMCNILENYSKNIYFDEFLSLVKKTTEYSISKLQRMQIKDEEVFNAFFGKNRHFLIGVLKNGQSENSYQVSDDQLSALFN